MDQLVVFDEIESTNTYLMQNPGPSPGMIHVAVTSNQTAGRGRHGKIWRSPPGSGVCLSLAYSFASQPDRLPALTLVLGLAAVDALESLGARNISIKWPNDLVSDDGKLGGILTEVHSQGGGATTIVAGIGVNFDLEGELDLGGENGWTTCAMDLASICKRLPQREAVAAALANQWLQACVAFESSGLGASLERWPGYDWLAGRSITVDTGERQITGTGAGLAEDGALLVEAADAGLQRVSSGNIVLASSADSAK